LNFIFTFVQLVGAVVVQLGRFRAAIPSRTAMPGRPVYGGAFARLRALRREQRQLEARGPRRLVEAAHEAAVHLLPNVHGTRGSVTEGFRKVGCEGTTGRSGRFSRRTALSVSA